MINQQFQYSIAKLLSNLTSEGVVCKDEGENPYSSLSNYILIPLFCHFLNAPHDPFFYFFIFMF